MAMILSKMVASPLLAMPLRCASIAAVFSSPAAAIVVTDLARVWVGLVKRDAGATARSEGWRADAVAELLTRTARAEAAMRAKDIYRCNARVGLWEPTRKIIGLGSVVVDSSRRTIGNQADNGGRSAHTSRHT